MRVMVYCSKTKVVSRTTYIFFSITGIFIGLVFVIFTLTHSKLIHHNNDQYNKHRVILVVLDGFRHDYLEIFAKSNIMLPNLNKLNSKGARVMKMIPVFPSVTMPNHQSLITGLFSPYHGITNNNFKDSSMNYDQFVMTNQTSLNENRWYKNYPNPIWVSCEKDQNCKSGSMLWPNTDAEINGFRPSKRVDQYVVHNFNPKQIYPYDRRVDEMLSWIKEDLIDFGMMYFDEPDATAHKYGPVHQYTLKKIVEMDHWIGRLLKGIKTASLSENTDIIITADHGMTELSMERVINIDHFVPPDLYVSTYSYPVGAIYPKKGNEQRVYELYKNASDHINVYWRKDVPAKYKYQDNRNRIAPIVTIVDNGWIVNSSHNIFSHKLGNHGYYQGEDDMKATFLATGPSFKKTTIATINNVDVYPLIMHLLGLYANPNNGSINTVLQILTEPARIFVPRESRWRLDWFVLLIYILSLDLVIICALCFVKLFYSVIVERRLRTYDMHDMKDKSTLEPFVPDS